MFSVVVCVYVADDAKLLKQSLKSIFEQTLKPSEVVLVQDGPLTKEILEQISEFENLLKYDDIAFKNISLSRNLGHGKARMVGIKSAEYNIIAICDSDDINYPNRFEEQYKFLENSQDISVVGSQIMEISINKPQSMRVVPINHEEILRYCRFRCPMNQMTVMFRKDDIMEVGGYKDFYHNEDYYLWIRLIASGYRLANLPNVLVDANVDQYTFKRRGGYSYFKSEFNIQKLLLKKKITNHIIFFLNISIRIVVQVLMPSHLRKLAFKYLFRKKLENK